MDSLLKAIAHYPNGTPLVIQWQNGCIISGEIDTIYESDNGLEPNNPNYLFFYICVFRVIKFLMHPDEKLYFSEGDLIEVSMQNPPIKVQLNDGTIIWEAEQG